ncbi:MAG: flagellar type III secretion system pore protein FliP [Gemmatimonadaceae bacterium]|nr:flagellar type III secretion system pore protein FliP [Gemmatimonadaceae bacterium]
MTLLSALGVVGMLGLVLALLVVTLRLLKRYAPSLSGGKLPLEVIQRLPLSPRQSIAIVRIGPKLMAVSVGKGGVRPVLELPAELLTQPTGAMLPTPTLNTPATATTATVLPSDFRRALRTALRSATTLALLIVATPSLRAQAPAAPAASTPAAASAPAPSTVNTRTAPRTVAAPSAPTAATPTKPVADSAARVAALDSAARAAKPRAGAKGTVPLVRPGADTMLSKLAPRLDLRVGDTGGGLRLSGTVGVVVMMGLLTLLPTLVLMMTGFTRILIVLQFLRQAIGTQSAPPGQVIAGLALLITGFVMAPTLTEVNRTALEPWLDGRMEQAEMISVGVVPFKQFMARQTRDKDIAAFLELSNTVRPPRAEDAPLTVLMAAFVTSELRTAFQIGFALFLPFIVIDVVVASVLMSMGMMMLPPAMISLPFKLLLFVLVDGWTLIVQGLVQSFR